MISIKNILLLIAVMSATTTFAKNNTDLEVTTLKVKMAQVLKKIETLESQKSFKKVEKALTIPKQKSTLVKSKVSVLEISGKHYLGFLSDNAGENRKNKFETRRNYLQVKGYFIENPKDYFRITLNTFHNTKGDGKDKGSWEVRLKYAYLYLDNVLPYTGIEVGQVHRPWIDYEEHHSWNYRSIFKVFIEANEEIKFISSADLGVNFKTKMDYFSSEMGIFNGEGSYGIEDGNGFSGEFRFTGHLFGTGKQEVSKDSTYADISFFGQYYHSYKKKGRDLGWYGVHIVYNQPKFLLSAQYTSVPKIEKIKNKEVKGYSFNGEFRLTENWNLFARYDYSKVAIKTMKDQRERVIWGTGYQYNKDIEFIINYLNEKVDDSMNRDAIMLSAEVNW